MEADGGWQMVTSARNIHVEAEGEGNHHVGGCASACPLVAADGSGLRRSDRRYVVAGHGHGWSVLWVLDVRKPRQGRVNTAQGG